MADQSIEIKLVLRDELTKQLQPIIAQLKQLNTAVDGSRFQQASQSAQHFGRTIQGVRRELSTLASLTFGGIIGGGIVAGLVATGKALSDMAGRSLQLRYIADSLGTQTSVLNDFSDAFMGLGKSQEEGASAIQGASKALRELQIEGRQSGLFKQLESAGGASGRRIAQEMAKEMAGPRGLQGGLEHALRRMANMGQADAAKFGQILGFGPGFGRQAARDYLEVLGQLPKRLELPRQQALDLAKANAAWGISWDNIKTTLGAAFIPTFAKITASLDEFLQSPSGQNFAAQLSFWGYLLGKAVDEWLKSGGLERAAKGLKETVGYLHSGFLEADKVLKAMDISWPQIIAGLIGLRVLSPILRGLVAPLAAIGAIPGVLTLLTAMAIPGLLTALIVNKDAIRDALAKQKESQGKDYPEIDEETRKQGYVGQILDMFWQFFKGNWNLLGRPPGGAASPMSGEDTGKTEPERRADLDEKKRANRELTREFAALEYEMTKLNAYIQPGGPEGGGGRSGTGPGGTANLATYTAPDVYGNEAAPGLAAVRHNNPGAMFPGSIADRYGSIGTQQLLGGKYKIATFPTPVHGAAANFYNLMNNPKYQGKTVRQAIETWSDKLRHDVPGYDPNMQLTSAMLNDPAFAVPFMKAVSGGETSGKFPMSSAQWAQAHEWGKLGTPGYGESALTRPDLSVLDQGGDSITQHLAQRDRALGGSATVDIDIGGLGQSARNPSSLFRPVPLGGIEQMQNITKPENNPLSQQ